MPSTITQSGKNLEKLSPEQLRALVEQLSTSKKRGARKKKTGVQYLTEEEVRCLFGAIQQELERAKAAGYKSAIARAVRDMAIFELAYHRGLRASEIGQLQMANLRLAHKRLYVTRLKGGISGEFLLTDRELKVLKAYLRERGNAPGCLFPSRQGGAITRGRLDQLMKGYAPTAGLPPEKRHFHCLRHTCATKLLDLGVPIEEVQDHLGHTDIRNTMIYARVTNRKRQAKDERLAPIW